MKKLLFIFFALALFWGCEKSDFVVHENEDELIDGEIADKEETDNPVTDYVLPEILYASMTDEDEDKDKPQTRTVVGDDGRKILWQNGDAVSYFAGNVHNARYTYDGEEDVSSAVLIKDDTKPGTTGAELQKSQAVYPYNENVRVEYDEVAKLDKIYLTYPTTQTYAANSFGKDANIMVAAGMNNEDNKLYFRNACGYLVIKLYGTASIKNITLSSVSGTDKIAGSAVVVASHDAVPVITMTDDASTAVTLDCSNSDAGVVLGADAEKATEFWFCLPPVTFTDGIKITVNDMYGNAYTKQTSKTVTIERNKIQPMAALEFVSNAPAATKLWYTRSDDRTGDENIVKFYDDEPNPFDAAIKSHKWDGNKFVIEFASPLTTIKEYAFRETQIETITLPEGLVTIEKEAFRETPLTEITIPGSVNNVGIDVFWECNELSKVTFLPSVTKTPLNIGYLYGTYRYGPFYDSPLTSIDINRELILVKDDGSNFTQSEWWHGMFANEYWDDVESVSIKIGPQVETLSNYMFNYLPIQTLTIPGTVNTIGNCVFDGCESLTSLTYEPSPTGEALTHGYNDDSDDDGPFYASPLTSVNLNREINYTYSSSAGNASEGLFGNRTTLTNVTLGDQVKTLHKYMFAGSGITSLNLNKVETIKEFALAGVGFNELIIPGTVTTIQNDVFRGCTNLATLTFKPSPSGTALTMGYDTNGEAENLFQDNEKLETLNLNREIIYTLGESSIDTNSEGLFGGMPTLTSVTLGEQVKTLHKYMFAGSGITSLNLNKVETIKDFALAGVGITELTIPGTVTTIQNDVFRGCTNLATLTFQPSSSGKPLAMGYDTADGDENLFQDNNKLETLNLNREINYTLTGVNTDSEGLFGGMSTLTSVTLGEQVKKLSNHMFAGSSITELIIPGSVNTIENDAFHGCKQLETLTFNPSPSVTALTMGYDTYGEAENLFQDNEKLETLNLNREIIYTLGESSIDTNSEGLFGGMSTLTSVTLGDQVKTLHKYMFAGSGITSLNLNKVVTIKDFALAGVGITELTIPGTVTTINNNVFNGCKSLKSLTFQPGSSSEDKLTVGYNDDSYDEGLFIDSPLESVTLNREIEYTYPITDLNEPSEGLFGNKPTLINITIGNQVKNLSPYIFANSGINILNLSNVETVGKGAFMGTGITSLMVYPSLTLIDDHAFAGCESLEEVVLEASTQPLTIGFQPGGDQHGPFWQSPLNNVVLKREITPTEAYADACNHYDEGIFANEHGLETIEGRNDLTVQIISNVNTIHPFMFSGWGMDDLTIPACVTEIKDFAFYNCKKLTDLTISSSTQPLTIGFQDWDDELGPFYQSPLKNIKLGRNIVYNDNYAESCDSWDEGAFSNEYYDDNVEWTTDLILGPNVTTILKYMFAGTRIQQLHIPETVENIGVNVIENNEKLNAIIFYDETERPNVEYGAFGEDSVGLDLENYPPGKGQYYIFVPYRLGRLGSYRGELYYTQDDLVHDTYWDVLHAIMVDDQPRDDHYQPHRNTESWYLNVTGYEWYKARYYDYITITPPTI